jgi:hypothetical protein
MIAESAWIKGEEELADGVHGPDGVQPLEDHDDGQPLHPHLPLKLTQTFLQRRVQLIELLLSHLLR